jgi:hypothetical protein
MKWSMRMWSLARWLASLAKTDHLPEGFSAANGIRSLFPSGLGASSITLLKNYLYAQDCTVSTSEITGAYRIRADGSGRWLFQGFIAGVGAPNNWQQKDQTLGAYGAGFVFLFSTNRSGHGAVLTNIETDAAPGYWNVGQGFQMFGSDPWIKNNWPGAFAESIGCYISHNDSGGGLPPLSNAATDHGFAGLSSLETSRVQGVSVCIWDGPVWGPESTASEPTPLVWELPTEK